MCGQNVPAATELQLHRFCAAQKTARPIWKPSYTTELRSFIPLQRKQAWLTCEPTLNTATVPNNKYMFTLKFAWLRWVSLPPLLKVAQKTCTWCPTCRRFQLCWANHYWTFQHWTTTQNLNNDWLTSQITHVCQRYYLARWPMTAFLRTCLELALKANSALVS